MKYLLGLVVMALAACQPATQPPVSTPSVVVAQGSMASLLNSQRAAQGLGPLRENANLSRSARAHAQDMVTNGYFAHRGRDGSSFADRARAAGYACPAAENLASGQRSEAEVMTSWMNSSGHRRNILLADAKEYGLGRVGTMWVLVLGRGC